MVVDILHLTANVGVFIKTAFEMVATQKADEERANAARQKAETAAKELQRQRDERAAELAGAQPDSAGAQV